MIGLGGDQETVDEARGGPRLGEGRDHDGEVYVGGDDMGGLAEVDRLTHDDVVAGLDLLDDARVLARLLIEDHVIAHRHRVGGAQSVEAYLAPKTAVPTASRLVEDNVPASR